MTKDNKVKDLDSLRPHVAGQTICVACSYSWIGVVLQTAKKHDLECPRCQECKGVFIGLLNDEEPLDF